MVRYSDCGYRVYVAKTRQVHTSCDVKFDEEKLQQPAQMEPEDHDDDAFS